ncbi:MAG: hypothetical protein ABJH98_07650 [Reichenbachiella sp.]|uniref:hypothetical protein n=1 Tax=Reichenbachiella sp. TaxID=2184521 RepID=UPI0032989DA8
MIRHFIVIVFLGLIFGCSENSSTADLSSEANILTFDINGGIQIGSAIIDEKGHSISAEVSFDTDLSDIAISFTLSEGASATHNNKSISNTATFDFTNPIDWVVTAADGTSQIWTINIELSAPLSDALLLSYRISGQNGQTEINSVSNEVTLIMPYGTDFSSLVADFTVSDFATVRIEDEIQESGITPNDFTSSVEYTVTAQDGVTTSKWIVTLDESPEPLYSVSTLVEEFPGNDGISVDSDGNIYVNCNGLVNMWNGTTIYKVTPVGEFSLFKEGLPSWPVGSVLDQDGNMYVSGWNAPGIISKIDLSDASSNQFYSGVQEASGLEIDENGNIYAMEPPTNSMLKIEPDGTKSVFASGSPFNKSSGITYDVANKLFYVTNWNDGVISQVNESGEASNFATLPVGNLGPIINDDHYLYTTSYNANKVFRVSKASGEYDLIAGTGSVGHIDGYGTVATFDRPLGIALSPDGSKLYISEVSPGGKGSLRVITEN